MAEGMVEMEEITLAKALSSDFFLLVLLVFAVFAFKRFLLGYLVLGTNSYVLSVTIFLLYTAFNHSLLFELVSLPSNTSGKHVLNSPNVALSMVSTITSFDGESSLFAITFAKALSSFFFLLIFFVFVVVAYSSSCLIFVWFLSTYT